MGAISLGARAVEAAPSGRFLAPQTGPAPERPVTAVTLGAGNRGNVYGDYAVAHPDELDIVGAAEPIQIRRRRYAATHDIPAENLFTTWEHVFERPKFADAVLVTTPDDLHYGPCMAALEMGYDVLLEKPISPSERECLDILRKVEETGRVVAVCHVLRYAPYFQRLQAITASGVLGRVVSMQHLEPIHHLHMAHSYVRGNWHDSTKTTPIILAKSCHDLDILRWLMGQRCTDVQAFGSLDWFHEGNAPEGSTGRCMDGCAIESTCTYSALRGYHRRREYTYVFDLPEDEAQHGDTILEYLRSTDYGRCVYRMDNDQPDHYTVNLRFADGATSTFNMEAFTSYHGRRTRIMGSEGDVVGDMARFVHTDFGSGEETVWETETDGHGGGDWRLVADWVRAVASQDASKLVSTIQESVESHVMGFRAEVSRRQGTVEAVTL